MKHTKRLLVLLIAALMLASCSDRDEGDSSDTPSTQPPIVTTAPQGETEKPKPTPTLPEVEGEKLEFVTNDGNLKLSTLQLNAEHYHPLRLDENRMIYVLSNTLRDKDGNVWKDEMGAPVMTNIRVIIYNTATGETSKAIPIGGGIRPTSISVEDDGVVLYWIQHDANGVVTYPAWRMDPDAKSPTLTPVKFDGSRSKDAPYTSPDGKWTVYRQNLDLSGDHEIVLRDAKGKENVILEARMLEEAGAGLSDVEGYNLVGFLDNDRLVYNIGGWEWQKGYGIYTISTGKKTEFRDGMGITAIYDGKMYADDGNYESLSAFYEITPAGEKLVLTDKNENLIPKADYYYLYGMYNGYWLVLPYDGEGLGDLYVYDTQATKLLAQVDFTIDTMHWMMVGDTIVAVTTDGK